jgi:hypothetical protein
MSSGNASEVATFREQQTLREQSAQQGLNGLATVAKHENITARMEQGADRILALFQAGRKAEAEALMSKTGWC